MQLYQVVRFFHPRSSCTAYISADVQRITLNASCMTISGGRTKQLVIILQVFCRVTGFTSDFLKFHSCRTYSVLSWSPSIARGWMLNAKPTAQSENTKQHEPCSTPACATPTQSAQFLTSSPRRHSYDLHTSTHACKHTYTHGHRVIFSHTAK